MPEFDNLIGWANSKIIHDGEKLTRQEKIILIKNKIEKLSSSINLRVCYSDYKEIINCCSCEKCLRSIFGLMIIEGDPRKYGFNIDENIYNEIISSINKGFSSQGTQLFWKEIYEEARKRQKFFYFKSPHEEAILYTQILNILKNKCYSEVKKGNTIKQSIVYRYPLLFNLYLKVRRKLK